MSKRHPYTAIKHGKVHLVVGVQSFELAYSPCEDTAADNRKALRWMQGMLDKALDKIIAAQSEALREDERETCIRAVRKVLCMCDHQRTALNIVNQINAASEAGEVGDE